MKKERNMKTNKILYAIAQTSIAATIVLFLGWLFSSVSGWWGFYTMCIGIFSYSLLPKK